MGMGEKMDWKEHGLRIIRSDALDTNTLQTPGMTRAEAISRARVGAQKLWAGTVVVHPNAKTGPHHHGELETVIYIVRGRARFRWGERLEFVDEAGPGDFVYVPPYVPHQELNAKKDEPVEAVIVRSGQEPVVVNLDIPSPEEDNVPQPDPFHSGGVAAGRKTLRRGRRGRGVRSEEEPQDPPAKSASGAPEIRPPKENAEEKHSSGPKPFLCRKHSRHD
jgi:uncharacterized RmlC-like cupin family protein